MKKTIYGLFALFLLASSSGYAEPDIVVSPEYQCKLSCRRFLPSKEDLQCCITAGGPGKNLEHCQCKPPEPVTVDSPPASAVALPPPPPPGSGIPLAPIPPASAVALPPPPPPPGIFVPAPGGTVVPVTPVVPLIPPPSGGLIPLPKMPPASFIPSSPLPPPPLPPAPPPPPPTADDKTPRPEEGEQPLRRCEELPSETRACCVKYDEPANGGNGDGRPNGKELARLVKDETCSAEECSGFFKIFAGEGSSVTVNGFNQCCQILRNKGEVVNLTMQQNCENHMGLATPASAGGGKAGDVSAPAGGPVADKSLTDGSKADEGGCQLIRPE